MIYTTNYNSNAWTSTMHLWFTPNLYFLHKHFKQIYTWVCTRYKVSVQGKVSLCLVVEGADERYSPHDPVLGWLVRRQLEWHHEVGTVPCCGQGSRPGQSLVDRTHVDTSGGLDTISRRYQPDNRHVWEE